MRGSRGRRRLWCLFPFLVLTSATTRPAAPHRATHEETAVIGDTPETRFGRLSTVCLTPDGKLLAGDTERKEIKVLSLDGKVLEVWRPPIRPYAIKASADGTVYLGGRGYLAKLDRTGKVLKTVYARDLGFPRSKVSGMALTGRDLFVAFGRGGSLGSKSNVYRFNLDLGEPVVIARDMRGCCQRLDMVAQGDVLYVAENARHRVVRLDRTGKVLGHWGRRDRSDLEGFGSCCNPMNLCIGPEKVLYTAESGLGRVKRYTLEGRYLGLVGYVGVARFTRAGHLAASCSNIALAVTPDGSRLFVQDVRANLIRVLTRKGD